LGELGGPREGREAKKKKVGFRGREAFKLLKKGPLKKKNEEVKRENRTTGRQGTSSK